MIKKTALCSRRSFVGRCGLALVAPMYASGAVRDKSIKGEGWIGFTEYRTNLEGGRHPNVVTMRAAIVRANGRQHQRMGTEFTQKPNTWTQFAGWSPDGEQAILGNGWESPENGAWEEAQKTFRFNAEGWLYDTLLVNLQSGKATNVTAIDRVSFYNTGVFFWPKQPNRLGFQALINGDSHPFSMDLDGRNKVDLTAGSKEFAYGFNASPDGTQIAYHKSYQVYIARADGSDAKRVETGKAFNFVPQWSPDGEWLLFVAGEHYNCHPHIVRRDGTGLRKVADRQGYRGVVSIFDVPDFHGGSSDVPLWSPDGKWVYYTAMIGSSVELMRVSLDGNPEQLTTTPPNSFNYHPQFSPDGKRVVFGSNRTGSRQLFVMQSDGGECSQITRLEKGWGAMWPHWQPALKLGRQ